MLGEIITGGKNKCPSIEYEINGGIQVIQFNLPTIYSFTQHILNDHIYHVPGSLLNTEIITVNSIGGISALMEKTVCLGQWILNNYTNNSFISIVITARRTV